MNATTLRRTLTALALIAGLPACGAATAGGESPGSGRGRQRPEARRFRPQPGAAAICCRTATSRTAAACRGPRRSPRPATARADVENGELCVEVTNKGTNNWDAQFRHREMVIKKGHVYTVKFKARASTTDEGAAQGRHVRPALQRVLVEHDRPRRDAAAVRRPFHDERRRRRDRRARLPHRRRPRRGERAVQVCVDDVELLDPEFKPPPRQVDRAAVPRCA